MIRLHQRSAFGTSTYTTLPFQPAWWCRSPHLQTLWPIYSRLQPRPFYRRERLELEDGDFLDLDWLGPNHPETPVILVLHGLEGSSQSHYVRALALSLASRNLRTCAMHFRGCSGEINRLPRSYHAGETRDLDFVINRIRERFPSAPLFAVGYSLGANMLLKWLGEQGEVIPLSAAIGVSVPFDLGSCAARLEVGLSRIYQYRLLRSMKSTVRRKAYLLHKQIDVARLLKTRTFRTFDNLGTAPIHGFQDADDYYSKASCRPFLGAINTPVLIVQAIDDPLMWPASIPSGKELGPGIVMETSTHGGHVGFVGGPFPGMSRYWLEQNIINYLDSKMP